MPENDNGLMPVDAAYETLREQIYAPVFFAKLASFGVVPQSQGEQEELYLLAEKLRQATGGSEKSASGSGRFGDALYALENVLDTQPVSSADASQAIKTAAAQTAADPVIYNSVLSLLASAAQ
jgi:hypothetical protein